MRRLRKRYASAESSDCATRLGNGWKQSEPRRDFTFLTPPRPARPQIVTANDGPRLGPRRTGAGERKRRRRPEPGRRNPLLLVGGDGAGAGGARQAPLPPTWTGWCGARCAATPPQASPTGRPSTAFPTRPRRLEEVTWLSGQAREQKCRGDRMPPAGGGCGVLGLRCQLQHRGAPRRRPRPPFPRARRRRQPHPRHRRRRLLRRPARRLRPQIPAPRAAAAGRHQPAAHAAEP